MLDKLEAIYSRYCEIEQQMNDPAVTGDMKRYVKLSKVYKDLQPVVKAYHDYKALLDTIAECKELLENEKDAELREMAKEELTASQERREKMEDEIRILLIPADPTDSKNAVVEIAVLKQFHCMSRLAAANGVQQQVVDVIDLQFLE